MTGEGDYLRSSPVTLGGVGTGYRGLLDRSLRLGKILDRAYRIKFIERIHPCSSLFYTVNFLINVDFEEKDEKIKKGGKDGNIRDLNNSLEELLKSLNEGDKNALEKLKKEKDGNVVDFGKNGYENLETISQITTKLQLDMNEFHSHYNTKYTQEDTSVKKSKERDLLMMAEGKNELLKKQFNQMTIGPSKYAGHQNGTFNNNYPRAFRDKGPIEDHLGGDISIGKDPDSGGQNDPTRSASKVGLDVQVTFNEDDDDDSASNELIITNGDVSNSLIIETEQKEKEKLKNFQTGLAERIKELELLHAAALADISVVTDPKSEIQVPTSRIQGLSSENEVRESTSGIKDPRSGPGISFSGIQGLGAGHLPPGFLLENMNYDQTEFQNLSRPSNNEMERKNYFKNFMIQNVDQDGDGNIRNNNINNNTARTYFNGNMNNYGHTYGNNNNNNNNVRNDSNSRSNFNDYDNRNNNTNVNNSNNKNNNQIKNKNQLSPEDVRSHPYAPSPYVQSLCPELVHANILTVSKGALMTLHLCVLCHSYYLC